MIPKTLKIQNFLSHDQSEIDFDKFKAALILGTYENEPDQSNGCGKTSLLEAISWALFGKSRHKKVNGVVKWDKRTCRVDFTFEVDGELYKVIRTRDKVLNDSDITLEQWNGSEFKGIDCDTNTATDKKIISIINFNYEVFINSVYFKQDDISVFATSTPSKRKDILKSLLKMEKWDVYQKKAKDYVKILNVKIEEQNKKLIPSSDLENELNACKKSIHNLKKQIKENNDKYTEINSKFISKKSTYQMYYGEGNETSCRLKKLQKDATIAKNRLSNIGSEIKNNDEIIKSNTNQISECKQKIKVLKDRIRAKIESNVDTLRSNIVIGRTKEQILKDKVNNLKKDIKLSGDKCDLCKKPLTKKEIEDIKIQHKNELKEAELEYSQVCEKLNRAEKKLKQKENDVVIGGRAEIEKSKTDAKISRLQAEIDNCLVANKRLSTERSTINLSDLTKEIEDLKLKSDKETEEKLFSEIRSLESELQNIKRATDKLNIEYGSKIRRRNEIAKTQSEQAEIQKTIDKLKGEYTIYNKLKDYFGKDGIQSVIIENVIDRGVR